MVQTRQPSASSGTQAPAQAVSTWSGPAREQAVQRMFTSIAGVYDLNNTLLSFGLHYRWKKITASYVPQVEQGDRHSMWEPAQPTWPCWSNPAWEPTAASSRPTSTMPCSPRGSRRWTSKARTGKIACLQANAEHLGFTDNTFDAVTTGFCMRNVGNLPQAVGEIRRVMKPGGTFVCLEFSRPVFGWLRALYDWYSFKLLPWIGTKVARDTTGVYEYLPASIRTFPDQERLCQVLREAGFRQVSYKNLTGGIVAIHVAVK